jgi:hypothetical protein
VGQHAVRPSNFMVRPSRTDEMIGQLRRSPNGEASPDKDHASVRREEMVGLSSISDRVPPADVIGARS